MLSHRNLLGFLVIVHFLLGSCLCVKIRKLSVPSVVEVGSEAIELDCDYDYEEHEKLQLEVKWYFANDATPFCQWVPAQQKRPQIIGERFRGHVDLGHEVHADVFKRHRALLLKNLGLQHSGLYTCKVSTLEGEDVQQKRMTVYSPASFIGFNQERLHSGTHVNVSCLARGVAPMPRVKLTWGAYQLDDSDALVTSNASSGTYAIVVHRLVSHQDIPGETVFGCELSIPGTDYRVREESVYVHSGHTRSASQIGASGASARPSLITVAIFATATSLAMRKC